MECPTLIVASSFQIAWAQAILSLENHAWNQWNLIIQIENPCLLEIGIHDVVKQFAITNRLIGPDQVAYTIFPIKIYRPGTTKDYLYRGYKKYYTFTRKQPHKGWGTYFDRMIHYNPSGQENAETDQLSNIIDAINSRLVNYGASFVIIIPYPNRDSKRLMGAPCLNYITVQVENGINKQLCINMLAVYRNHDFMERAYGNYYGLCMLLRYIALETDSEIGRLTCVSSHAYVPNHKRELGHISTTIMRNRDT
jgi:thymidylate synthase